MVPSRLSRRAAAPRRLLIGRVLDVRAPLLHPSGTAVFFVAARAPPPARVRRRPPRFPSRTRRRRAPRHRSLSPARKISAAERAPKVEQRLLVGELDPRTDGTGSLCFRPARVVKVPVSTREPLRCESAHEHGLREVRGRLRHTALVRRVAIAGRSLARPLLKDGALRSRREARDAILSLDKSRIYYF